jgi:hypothetical protein
MGCPNGQKSIKNQRKIFKNHSISCRILRDRFLKDFLRSNPNQKEIRTFAAQN